MIRAFIFLVGLAVSAYAGPKMSGAILGFPDSTGTNYIFQVDNKGNLAVDGAISALSSSVSTIKVSSTVSAPSTNSAVGSIVVVVNGTNYVINLYPWP